jgi:ribonucleoside-diphosphate reductase alpha chain
MLSKNATYLLEQRYVKNSESPEGVFKRSAGLVSKGDAKFEETTFNLMANGVFIPNSPCLFNAGMPNGSLHACYILPINDDLNSIFSTVTNMARIFKSGGGVGINFSRLREANALLSGGGTSSGVLSFMEIFDHVVDTVKQGGMRRGALMGILNQNHPEIYNFIKVKLIGKLQNFNLSLMVDDEFMRGVDNDATVPMLSPKGYKVADVKAKDIFEVACFASWVNGDPAFLFHDRINKDNPFYPEIDIDTVNPCSEVAMPHYSACCLGSINLSKFVRGNEFNFERFNDVCVTGMRFLTNMNELSYYPLPEIENTMKAYNPVGLGLMGFADALIKLGIRYDSDDCLAFIDRLGAVYKDATLSYNPDKFYFYRRIIAPTGSLSILADCSTGVEPVYDVAFERSLTVGKIEEVRDLYKSEFVRTAHQVSPEWHVKILAQWQKWLDGGCSKTVNMPNTASVDDIKAVYKMAWKMGCKGITVYRDGCRDQQVLYSKPSTPPKGKCSDETCTL